MIKLQVKSFISYIDGSIIFVDKEGNKYNIVNSGQIQFESNHHYINKEGKPTLVNVSFNLHLQEVDKNE